MNLTRVVKNIFFLLVTVFSALTLSVITISIKNGTGEFAPFDNAISDALSHIRTGPLTHIMLLVTNIGSPFVLSLIAIILAILLVLHRDTFDTLLYIVAIALSIISFV